MSDALLKGTILIAEPDANARGDIAARLEREGYAVLTAPGDAEALELVSSAAPDVVVAALPMPKGDGPDLLHRLLQSHGDVALIALAEPSEIERGVAAVRAGAHAYLLKPLHAESLVVLLEQVIRTRALREELSALRSRLADKLQPDNIVGDSVPMQAVFKTVAQAAPTRASVLLTGETGTGKELIAQAIHAGSPRRNGPFVKLHCASLSEALLESELFGHDGGAAVAGSTPGRRVGRIEQADGGTLFLDEVGDLPPGAQLKLLRFLHEKAFERVGSDVTLHADVRVIASTHRHLEQDVREGRFREDLLYRLNVVAIEVPPLRVRPSDVLLLAEHFLRKHAAENGKTIRGFSPEAAHKVADYAWPGNVRELENVVERSVVMCEGDTILEEHLPASLASADRPGARIPGSTFAELEKHAILTTLEAVGWSTTRAARMLDISVRTIQYRLHEYGLARRLPQREHAAKA